MLGSVEHGKSFITSVTVDACISKLLCLNVIEQKHDINFGTHRTCDQRMLKRACAGSSEPSLFANSFWNIINGYLWTDITHISK